MSKKDINISNKKVATKQEISKIATQIILKHINAFKELAKW